MISTDYPNRRRAHASWESSQKRIEVRDRKRAASFSWLNFAAVRRSRIAKPTAMRYFWSRGNLLMLLKSSRERTLFLQTISIIRKVILKRLQYDKFRLFRGHWKKFKFQARVQSLKLRRSYHGRTRTDTDFERERKAARSLESGVRRKAVRSLEGRRRRKAVCRPVSGGKGCFRFWKFASICVHPAEVLRSQDWEAGLRSRRQESSL